MAESELGVVFLPMPRLPPDKQTDARLHIRIIRDQEEHVPMAVDKLAGKTKFIATKVVATPDGTPPPFYRIAEVYFPSLEALQAYASTITLSTIFDAGTIHN
jgi:hypothetical protein